MAERYTRLFTLTEKDLYCIDSPLLICAGALLKDSQTGKMIAQLKFRNICEKRITAIKVSIRAFDAFGTELEGIPEYQYLDLSLDRDGEIGSKVAVVLPNAETRSFSCVCQSVIFSDGTQWISTSNDWVPLKKQETLSEHLGNLADQYQRDTTKKARYVPIVDRDLWLCSCGAINRENEKSCHICSEGLETLTAALDSACLTKHLDEHNRRMKEAKIEQEKRANAKRIEDEQKAAEKRKKIALIVLIVSAVAAVVIIFAVLTVTVFVPNANYNKAVELYNAGKYEEGISAFEALGGYKDSEALIKKCEIAINDEKYATAMELYNSGKYEDAIVAFTVLDGYKDSNEQIAICKTAITKKDEQIYVTAVSYMKSEQYDDAIQLFRSITEYKDSAELLNSCQNAKIYITAINLMDKGNYAEAAITFDTIISYRDSQERKQKCEEQVSLSKYSEAVQLVENHMYLEAYHSFRKLNYKDSESAAKDAIFYYQWEQLDSPQIGSVIKFGLFEQDDDTENGEEEIEWLVLARNGSRILVISKYILANKHYHEYSDGKGNVREDYKVYWEKSTIRQWLNEDFYDSAFGNLHKSKIVTTNVSADRHPQYDTNQGKTTTDNIFLLSYSEVQRYMPTEEERQTVQTKKSIGKTMSGKQQREKREWWTRTTGDEEFHICFVRENGRLHKDGHAAGTMSYGIRPVMWIDLG
ncbi:MAG: DUF6273 domain-containing protein [Clostridia bacterium]|nr:DUF6273 domain-containing protein [Clostridia bacterium]